jgi:hypothetical protein
MERRLNKLEKVSGDHSTRIKVMEVELQHGKNIFQEVKDDLSTLGKALTLHMANEEKWRARMFKAVAGWLFLAVIALIVYIWKGQVGI